MMIKKDDSVVTHKLTPVTQWGLDQCDLIFESLDLEMVITSAFDGNHGANSKHYEGRAFDLRLPTRVVFDRYFDSWDQISRGFDENVCKDLRVALGPDFQVILETHQESPWSWHVHVELDPR